MEIRVRRTRRSFGAVSRGGVWLGRALDRAVGVRLSRAPAVSARRERHTLLDPVNVDVAERGYAVADRGKGITFESVGAVQ